MGKYDAYVEAWRARAKERAIREERAAEEAKAYAIRCAKLLGEEFGVKRVYLFGSLAEGYFREGSDIDLAVEALNPHLYFKALSRLHRVSGGFEVDLVPLEDHRYKTEIIREGEVLYDIWGGPEAHTVKGKHTEDTG